MPTFKVPLSAPIRKAPGRTEFQRGILAPDGKGGFTVRTTGDQGRESCRRCRGRTASSCSPTDTGNCAAGDLVSVQLLEGLI